MRMTPDQVRSSPETTSKTSGNYSADRNDPSLIDLVLEILEDAKAEDIVTIDLEGKSSLGDYMVIASGRSNRHVSSVADKLIKKLKESGYGRATVEGLTNADWVLIDASDVIIHVFRPEVREFYNLEKIWMVDNPGKVQAS